jgi:release factor glutamine methyltransferase
MTVSKKDDHPSINSLLEQGVQSLEEASSNYAVPEAEILLAFVLGTPRLDLKLSGDRVVSKNQADEFLALIGRKCQGEPLAYMTGEQEFMSLNFLVEPGVLIPRPETEILVEKVIEFFQAVPQIRGLDVGTGTGCIPISLIAFLKADVRFVAVDISTQALHVALENSIRHRVDNRIEFMISDVFVNLPQMMSFDVITGNLPYVTDSEFETLTPEVKDFEPAEAIKGGKDGLDCITRFVEKAWTFLKPGGMCFVEIGYTQGEKVQDMFFRNGNYSDIGLFQDYSGLDRVVYASRGN